MIPEMPMPILTPRLMIKPRRLGEGKIIAQAIIESLEHLKPYMPFAQRAPTEEEVEENCCKSVEDFEARRNFNLSIYDRERKVFIGSTGIHRPNWEVRSFEVGYWVHKDFLRHGMILEAANAVTRYAFNQLKARRVEMRCDSRNLGSFELMKKLGFVQEGLLHKDSLGVDGNPVDTIITARCDLYGMKPLEVTW
ncbi:MAG: GNAT family N-acetyltransferase [Bdellovibrionota bacterium]